MERYSRWIVTVPVAVWLSLALVQGQAVSPDPSGAQFSFLERAFDKGGGYAIAVILLFFYRRDYSALVAPLTQLVINATAAQTETAAAMRENTAVVHGLKSVLQHYLPQQALRELEIRREDDRAKRRGTGEAT
jgi:hypothetical protein